MLWKREKLLPFWEFNPDSCVNQSVAKSKYSMNLATWGRTVNHNFTKAKRCTSCNKHLQMLLVPWEKYYSKWQTLNNPILMKFHTFQRYSTTENLEAPTLNTAMVFPTHKFAWSPFSWFLRNLKVWTQGNLQYNVHTKFNENQLSGSVILKSEVAGIDKWEDTC